jgi:Protein of unknown function (DUF1275)
MGTQNAAARKLAVPDLTTTVLTLTITGIFADGRLAGGASSKVGRRLMSIASMFLGGLVGAGLVLHADAPLAIAVAAIVLVAVAVTAAIQSRTLQRAGGLQPGGAVTMSDPSVGAAGQAGTTAIASISTRKSGWARPLTTAAVMSGGLGWLPHTRWNAA